MSMANHLHRRTQAGFTLGEMVGVVAIVTIVTVLAYPAMRTFSGRNDGASAATRITRTINRARDQAKRRNRVYLVDFAVMIAGAPGGRVDFYESQQGQCRLAIDDVIEGNAAAYELVESLPVGGTVVPRYVGPNEPTIGIRGWSVGGAPRSTERIRLCLAPNGATFLAQGANTRPLPADFVVFLQRYDEGQGAPAVGPMRRIQMTFAGPARLAVK
ncbi:MAG: hypothetical protein VX589_20050 [Myxococcota bacterium]|nr:hypothetical protein [Myxococcota bacterium]